MASIKEVKGRKDYQCSKCRQPIKKGEVHLVGSMNFSKPIRRHIACGLKRYELTTSDYLREIGRLQEEWREDYGTDESAIEGIVECLETIRDEAQERFDNIPESLQYAPQGEMLQERIDGLEYAIDELQNIDIETMKQDVVAEVMADELAEDDDLEIEYDTYMADTSPEKESKRGALQEALEQAIENEIEGAFSNLAE